MAENDEPTIIEVDRPINELLACDTYQGMSDSEIELIIEYRCDIAVRDTMANYEQTQLLTIAAQTIVNADEMYERARDVLESTLRANVPMMGLDSDGNFVTIGGETE